MAPAPGPDQPMAASPARIGILGAGSLGAYLGGSLMAAGAQVCLIGRPRMRQRIARHGLILSNHLGQRIRLPSEQVNFTERPESLSEVDLILLCVKSADTAAAAAAIASHARIGTPVISMQNGIGNSALLRKILPAYPVLAAMAPFNVVQLDDGRLHRGTAGELMVEASTLLAPWHDLFAWAGLPLQERQGFDAVLWGKLLLNLNNPVNALSGLPLKLQLSQRPYRLVLAALIAEALQLMARAGIRPAAVGRAPPRWLPSLLRLPDFLFTRLAARMLGMDAEARSSMWEDLRAGRPTEVDFLNGAVLELARTLGRDAPLNRRICALVHQAQRQGLHRMSALEMGEALRFDPD